MKALIYSMTQQASVAICRLMPVWQSRIFSLWSDNRVLRPLITAPACSSH